jgi:N-terminal domain of galactosyltransferase/N-terminal region of glycosyl transferase group 7
MFIFLITYRARGVQAFRRKELIDLIQNMETYFKINNGIAYKIIICEQNNDKPFNRGILNNIAFLESDKMFENCDDKNYFTMDVDNRLNVKFKFPLEYLSSNNGIKCVFTVDVNTPHYCGTCLSFKPIYFYLSNGFPNDMYGWGGEDWALMRRIREKGIPYDRSIINSGLIINESGWAINNPDTTVVNDYDTNQKNMKKALQDPINNNGLDSCIYCVDSYGEFHNGDNVYHILVSF